MTNSKAPLNPILTSGCDTEHIYFQLDDKIVINDPTFLVLKERSSPKNISYTYKTVGSVIILTPTQKLNLDTYYDATFYDGSLTNIIDTNWTFGGHGFALKPQADFSVNGVVCWTANRYIDDEISELVFIFRYPVSASIKSLAIWQGSNQQGASLGNSITVIDNILTIRLDKLLGPSEYTVKLSGIKDLSSNTALQLGGYTINSAMGYNASQPTNIINTNSANFSVLGQGTVGSQLSIIKTNDDPEGNGKFTYQWQSSADGTNWTPIGTNSSFYTVASIDALKQIRSHITYVDGKSFSESVDTSAIKIAAVASTKLTAGDFATPVNINLSLPAYIMSTNWNIDKYYYYVEQYPMTLRTAFYADYLAGRYTNQALYGQNHYLTGGQAEGRAMVDTSGILTDANDYGAYVENYGITLLDIYRVDSRAVVNGGTMSLFAWGKEHYTNWGKAEGREISGGVEWGGIVRNNLDLYNQWQDAKIVNPTLSAFAFGYQRQNTIKSTLGVLVGSDTADKLTGQIAYGLNGNDVICSDGGRGILAGGFGDDLLVAANGGSDLAYGGPGSDIFQLNPGSTFNIRDFRKGADMIQLGSALTSSGVTMQWDSADNSTLFYNGSSVIGKVYGKRPTEFTYSDSTNGVSKVYI